MSDLTYKLVVDMSTRGSLAPQLEKMGKVGGDLSSSLGSVKDMMGGVASSMAGAFTGAVEGALSLASSMAKVGTVGAVAAAGFGVKINAELEQAQVSLAAIFSSSGQSNGMLAGMKDAQSIMKDMRKDAADLPGEFKDVVQIFRMAATPAFQLGASIKQLETMSANSMAFAASRGIEMGQAARELGQLLQGKAGGHNVFGTLLGFSGDKAGEFNKLNGKARLGAVDKELGKHAESREFFAGTFDALSSSMIDNAKAFLGTATSGLFDRIKGAMESANTWYGTHEMQVTAFAENVGAKLSYAFEFGRRKIEEWGPALIDFAGNAYAWISRIWDRIGPMLESVGESMKKAFADPKTFDKLETILKLYAAVKIGGMVMPGVGTMASMAPALAGAGGLELGALAGGAAFAGAAVGVLGLAIYGAVDNLTDSTKPMHEFAVQQMSELATEFAKMKDTVTDQNGAVTKVTDALGVGLLVAVNELAKSINFWIAAIGSGLSESFGGLFTSGKEWFKTTGSGRTYAGNEDEGRYTFMNDGAAGILNNMFVKSMSEIGGNEAANKAANRTVHGGGGTNIQKVEIVVSSNQDPSRIARAVQDRMLDMSRTPTSSRNVRNWGSARP